MAWVAPDSLLNWLGRYLPLREHLQGDCLDSLLEVGSGHRGVGCILQTPFVGAEIAFHVRPLAPMLPFQYSPGRLPFVDKAFHTALSMDTLEHVPPAERAGFISELLRVSAQRVILGFPVDAEGMEGDRFMQRFYTSMRLPEPDWLREHEEHGMPSSRETERLFDSLSDWTWRSVQPLGQFASWLLILADIMPDLANLVRPSLVADPEKLEAWIRAGDFGRISRRIYVLERRNPVGARVRISQPMTLVESLVCPDCHQPIAGRLEGELTCTGCARRFDLDARGYWPMQVSRGASSASANTITFTLSPDWLNEQAWMGVVASYLEAFSAEDKVVMHLVVDTIALSVEDALRLLQPVLSPYGQKRFATLELTLPSAPVPTARNVIGISTTQFDAAPWDAQRFRQVFQQALNQ